MDRIRRRVLKHYPDAWFFKVHGGRYGRAGVPDLIIVVQGTVFFFEVKRGDLPPSQRYLREAQLKEIIALRKAGANVAVVLSPEDTIKKIDETILPKMRKRD